MVTLGIGGVWVRVQSTPLAVWGDLGDNGCSLVLSWRKDVDFMLDAKVRAIFCFLLGNDRLGDREDEKEWDREDAPTETTLSLPRCLTYLLGSTPQARSLGSIRDRQRTLARASTMSLTFLRRLRLAKGIEKELLDSYEVELALFSLKPFFRR
uniref:Uncharacterized protein n=1 Tax=Lotharella oceanica TaxID=641309 RepID=A0A7S2X6U8_9EUKA|mmetsp:Transcript_13585/g.25905  ORF Transcript_13585/g.25905 Transcript_13585/m.25905 type:complete len:153 (+) Transcript_13585:470-928(+)